MDAVMRLSRPLCKRGDPVVLLPQRLRSRLYNEETWLEIPLLDHSFHVDQYWHEAFDGRGNAIDACEACLSCGLL